MTDETGRVLCHTIEGVRAPSCSQVDGSVRGAIGRLRALQENAAMYRLCVPALALIPCLTAASAIADQPRLADEVVPDPPNIVLILVDNLGYGELGCYGGGATRGAPTPRIDSIATAGLRLTNMNMETQCTPSRSRRRRL